MRVSQQPRTMVQGKVAELALQLTVYSRQKGVSDLVSLEATM